MLHWFEKHAPIRAKFKALLIVHGLLASIGVATTVLAGGGALLAGLALTSLAGTIVTVLIATDRICRPYVATVVRMEGLAAGDTTSAFPHADHTDCVGRMTVAMETFRHNAVEVQAQRMANERVVQALSEGLGKLAQNELSYRIQEPFPGTSDKLRQDFNSALDALAAAIDAVRRSASSVSCSSTEIRSASDDLALRNEQQAASLEETSAAMSQVTGIVRTTAGNAVQVQTAIAEAHREATEGGSVVRNAIKAMAEIETSAREISQIINVIDGIAFQTNLLALNAGVEAARAGDAGKGFAVVANEVRALAQRSADAAKDIKELITASSEQVEGGVRLVNETGSLLDKIVGSVGEINVAVSEIARSSESQSLNLEQVNSAIGDMDRMTQQNAAMVEQSTAAARALADEATNLIGLVSQFHTGSEAATSRVASLPASRARPAPARAPVTLGNLAVKVQSPAIEDDWSEF
ncbi:MAG TPA: methyl-accepting chemotaxis protein [Novosphingobium sp.]|nr:methyl-accepting chemotaxis protein [Novosphingobium sp.]